MNSLLKTFVLAVVLICIFFHISNTDNHYSKSTNTKEVFMSRLPSVIAIPFAAGERAVIFRGNLDDYIMVKDTLVYRLSSLKDSIYMASKVLLVTAKATPPKIYRYQDFSAERKQAVEKYLKQLKLFPLPRSAELEEPNKLREFISRLYRLLVTPAPAGLSFVLLLDYVEHLVGPGQPGMETPDQVIWLEFLHSLSISPALRKNPSQNAVICYQYDGPIPSKLKDFYEIELPFPDHEQTAAFIKHVANRNGYANLASDLPAIRLQRIVRGLPLKSIDRMFRHAAAQGKPLEMEVVISQKADSFIKVSDNTLSFMEANELTSFDQVIGMVVAKRVLAMYADLLVAGRAPGRALALIGPPGTCKTVLISLTAKRAGYNCVKFEQTKDPFVGRSEEKLRKALRLLLACAPVIPAIDEVDKALPNENQGVADGGVSSDQLAQLQYFLARDDLPQLGVFIMATSNAPQRLGTALQDRFLFLPVLGVIPTEIPELLRCYVKRLDARIVDDEQALLQEAGEYLYARSASPRQMLDVIRQCKNLNGPELKCADILAAAADYSGLIDPAGVQAAILQSVRMCSFRSWLPWAGNPNYPLPPCLEGIVEVENNTVNYEKLNEKLTELMPYAQL